MAIPIRLHYTDYRYNSVATLLSMVGGLCVIVPVIMVFVSFYRSAILLSIGALVLGVTINIGLNAAARNIATKVVLQKIENSWEFARNFAQDHPEYLETCFEMNPEFEQIYKERDAQYQEQDRLMAESAEQIRRERREKAERLSSNNTVSKG